jgi:hypothetical protein
MNEQKEPSAARTERLANEGDCKHRTGQICVLGANFARDFTIADPA